MRLTNEEQEICDAIRDAIKVARPRRTIGEVAASIGTTYDVLSSVCIGRTRPRAEIVDGVRAELGLPSDWPGGGFRGRQKLSVQGTPMNEIAILGVASAGEGATNVDVDESEYYVPDRLAAITDFGFVVDGDSMMPALQPGDIACFKRSSTPRRGYPFLVKDSSDGYRIKIIGYDTDHWTLESFNPAYPAEEMPSECQLQGYLVGWFRSRGAREAMDSEIGGLKLDPNDYFLNRNTF